MKLAYIDNLYQVPRVRVELTSEVFQTPAVTTLATSPLCRGQDLNLQGFPHTHLKRTRLPISPPAHVKHILPYWLKNV